MSDLHTNFLRDIDQTISKNFGSISLLNLRIIGFVALCLAGLSDRGTKDMDVVEFDTLSDSPESNIKTLILKEFGNRSPGSYRHGMYLDIVGKGITWLPPRARFEPHHGLQDFRNIKVFLLDPTDVCVTKVFSYFKSTVERANDKKDIIDSLDQKIITCGQFVRRVDEALNFHEIQAEAPEIYPGVIRFFSKEIIPSYGDSTTTLHYQIPSWMENI